MWFWFVLVFACGVAIDRLVVWEKDRAVAGERRLQFETICSLEKALQIAKMDIYAMKQRAGEEVDARDYVYENPYFEADFEKNGRAKTILRRRRFRRSA